MKRTLSTLSILLVGTLLVACDDETRATPDAGRPSDAGPSIDAGTPLPGTDAGSAADAGGGAVDAGPSPVDAGPGPGPGSERGPFSVTTTSASVSRGARNTPVTVYLPSGDATHPLIVFIPGFQLASSMYVPYLDTLASHGFIVIGADPSASAFSADHVAMRDDVLAVLDWATGAAPFSARVDSSAIGTTGHSLGGKVATMAAIEDARVGALFAIDPVDGDPSPLGGGGTTRPTITPEGTATLTIPVGYVGETTNATGGTGGMPCAPADKNFMQFYAGSTSAPWAAEWDVIGASHMDFVWNCMGSGLLNPCNACPAGPADPEWVREVTLELGVAFFRRHFMGEVALEPSLTGAEVPAGINVRSRP